MAMVRITETLIHEVENAINTMREKALEVHKRPTCDLGDATHASILRDIERDAYAAAPHLRGSLPAAWTNRYTSNMRVHFVNSDLTPVAVFNIELDSANTYSDPGKLRPSYSLRAELRVCECEDETREFALALQKYQEEANEVKAKYDNLRKQVVAFLGAQPSLNRALREQPVLEMYIPQKFLDRVAVKKSATKADRPKVELDSDALAAASVTYRITSALS